MHYPHIYYTRMHTRATYGALKLHVHRIAGMREQHLQAVQRRGKGRQAQRQAHQGGAHTLHVQTQARRGSTCHLNKRAIRLHWEKVESP